MNKTYTNSALKELTLYLEYIIFSDLKRFSPTLAPTSMTTTEPILIQSLPTLKFVFLLEKV